MKKLLLLLILTSIGLIWAQQTEDSYVTENDEHATDVTATEIIFNEPIAVSDFIDSATETEADTTPEQDLSATAEITYSEFTKQLNIPLWYRWREFSFNALVPYILSKGNNFTDDTVSGLGDISIGAGYGKYLEQYNTYLDFNLTAKLPTGQKDVKADDGNIYQLTSETLDISGAVSAFYFMDDFTFKSTLLYKMNGSYDDKGGTYNKFDDNGSLIDSIEDPNNDVGDLFVFSAGADYRWEYRLTFGLGILYGNHFAKEIEGDSQKNGLQYIDIIPTVKYPYSLFEFVVGVKVPVMTSAEDNDPDDDWSNQENRNPTFFFRTNYRIF
ncbi:MAG: hypothetical protein RBS89_01910 [Candidatus Delongbacteria bacterium]|jgi:hypothetical protein|nr:hypothetical protein [Candidatus Delongbacteria bacterium]